MDRMRALDAVWLEMEGDGPPIAIGTVSWAEGPPPDEAALRAMLDERLPRMERLHQRVDPRPGTVRRPAWVPAGADPLAWHLHRRDLGGSAGRAEVDAEVARIMTHHLDRRRPLWDLWLLTGLADAGWVLVWRVHHSVADGLGTLMLLGHGYDLAPDGGTTLAEAIVAAAVPAPGPDAGPDPEPGDPGDSGDRGDTDGPGPDRPATAVPGADALGRALRLGARRAAAAARLAGAAVATLPHLPAAASSVVPHPGDSLTGPVGHRRRWVSVDLPLPEVKVVARAHGATVNDVVLAAVTSGVRALLLARGEDVTGRTVRNLVPVSERPRGDGRSDNQVSALLTRLPVGVADPVERLAAVTRQVDHLKSAHAHLLGPVLLGLVDVVVPWQAQDAVVPKVADAVPSWFIDILTTNVPGPQFPLYLMGHRVRAMYPLIPVAGRTRITIGVFSYDGTINVGVTGDGDHAADVDVLAAGARDALQDLLARSG